MSSGPKISIITACYNAERTIEQTIQSVLSQTYDNIEYIVVDGASTDGTMDIVRKYENQIDIIISEPDKGVYDAFNKGAMVATGNYIQYLNADDHLNADDVIGRVSSFITEHYNPILVYGGIIVEYEDTGYKTILNKQLGLNEIQGGKMIPHPATFIKREAILQAGLFDTQYSIAADFDLICKVYKLHLNKVRHIQEVITNFRMGGISSDMRNQDKVDAEVKRILNNQFNKQTYETQVVGNELLLKRWLGKMLFEQRGIADLLIKEKVNNVVLWGTGELSVLIFKELYNKGINVQYYIDNDERRQQLKMNNVPIRSPLYFKENHTEVDCMIMTFEGRHEESVLKQIKSYNLPTNLSIYSWRDLIKEL